VSLGPSLSGKCQFCNGSFNFDAIMINTDTNKCSRILVLKIIIRSSLTRYHSKAHFFMILIYMTPGLKQQNNKIKQHISEMKADIKFYASLFSKVNLSHSSAWSRSPYIGACARLYTAEFFPFVFSGRDFSSVRQKVDCVLWLVKLESYTRVRRKFRCTRTKQHRFTGL
jgi:hypothetical protein